MLPGTLDIRAGTLYTVYEDFTIQGLFHMPQKAFPGRYLSDNSFLFRLTKRFTLFLLLQALVLLACYISGNFQNFLDSTQRFILLLSSVNAVMLVFFAAAGAAQSFLLIFITKKKRYALWFLAYLILLGADAAAFILLRGIHYLSAGLQPAAQ